MVGVKIPEHKLALARARVIPYVEQLKAVVAELVKHVDRIPIAAIAVYGSVLKGIGPRSDLDILVLVRDNFREQYPSFIDIDYEIQDIAEAARVNSVELDVHVSILSGFLDVTRDTGFKRSFSEANFVLWEDGVSLDSRIYTRP